MGIFLGLAFLTRVGAILAVFTIGLYLLITERHRILKSKQFLLTSIVTILTVIPYLIWNYFTYGRVFAFWRGYLRQELWQSRLERPVPWYILNYFKVYTDWILYIVFFIGLIYLINLIIGFDLLIKSKEEKLKSDLFITLMILSPLLFFLIFFKQEGIEPRWLYIMLPAVYFIVGKGLKTIYKYLSKINKLVPIVLIAIMFIATTQINLTKADSLIINKKDSYVQLKYSGLWIKENSNPQDIVIDKGYPQSYFWTERTTYTFPSSEEEFPEFIEKNKPKYMVLSRLEKAPDWAYSWPQNNQDKVNPVQAFFFDQEMKQPAVIIYEFILQ